MTTGSNELIYNNRRLKLYQLITNKVGNLVIIELNDNDHTAYTGKINLYIDTLINNWVRMYSEQV